MEAGPKEEKKERKKFVKSSSMLSRDKVLQIWLYLNLVDIEINGDFWEKFWI